MADGVVPVGAVALDARVEVGVVVDEGVVRRRAGARVAADVPLRLRLRRRRLLPEPREQRVQRRRCETKPHQKRVHIPAGGQRLSPPRPSDGPDHADLTARKQQPRQTWEQPHMVSDFVWTSASQKLKYHIELSIGVAESTLQPKHLERASCLGQSGYIIIRKHPDLIGTDHACDLQMRRIFSRSNSTQQARNGDIQAKPLPASFLQREKKANGAK